MESTVASDIFQRGARRGAEEALLRLLRARFGEIPHEIEQALQPLQSVEVLNQLISAAGRCDSLEAFRRALGEVDREA